MSGKINVVFGFFYLALTAVLGPAFLVPQLYETRAVMQTADKAVSEVKSGLEAGVAARESLVEKSSAAVVNIFEALKKQQVNGKSAHAHGNLEALLNIVAGFSLLYLSIPAAFKNLLTLLFLLGAVFHSGMLYLGTVFGVASAFKIILLGEVSLLAGLVLMGVAAFIGIKRARCPD